MDFDFKTKMELLCDEIRWYPPTKSFPGGVDLMREHQKSKITSQKARNILQTLYYQDDTINVAFMKSEKLDKIISERLAHIKCFHPDYEMNVLDDDIEAEGAFYNKVAWLIDLFHKYYSFDPDPYN